MIVLKQGDVYLDKDHQLVMVAQSWPAGAWHLVCFVSKEVLLFTHSLSTTQQIFDHLESAKFILNMVEPMQKILAEVRDG